MIASKYNCLGMIRYFLLIILTSRYCLSNFVHRTNYKQNRVEKVIINDIPIFNLNNNGIQNSNTSLQMNLKSTISFKKNRITFMMVFLISTTALLYVPSLGEAFAEYSPYIEDKVKWHLVYLSNDSGCENAYYQRMNLYDELASKYMDLYQFDDTRHGNPECISARQFDSKYQMPSDLELLIIVLDEELGERELHQYRQGALYFYDPAVSLPDVENKSNLLKTYHQHLIVICDCGSHKYSEPVWLLSHELSHFVLNYLQYPNEIAGNKIHETDLKYDSCIENSTSKTNYEQECGENIKTKIRLAVNAYSFSVMTPYQDAVGMKYHYDESVDDHKSVETIEQLWDDGMISHDLYQMFIEELEKNNKQTPKVPKLFTEPPKGEPESTHNKEFSKHLQGIHVKDIVKKLKNPSQSLIPESSPSHHESSIILVSEEIVPELGTTDVVIRDKNIISESRVSFTLEFDGNDDKISCLAPLIENNKFHIQCNSKLKDVTVKYKISN